MIYKIPAGAKKVYVYSSTATVIFDNEYSIGDLVVVRKLNEEHIGYLKQEKKACFILSHVLIKEKYHEEETLLKSLWSCELASDEEKKKYRNMTLKHGYKIENGKKISKKY